MPTIAVVGQRPHAGKTVLTTELAVCAGNGVIVDLDPAEPAVAWCDRRDAEWPRTVAVTPDQVGELIGSARTAGLPWVFVDVPSNADIEIIWLVLSTVDYTLIPSRPGMVELNAIGGVARFLRPIDARMAIVLNGCMPTSGKLADFLLRQAFVEAKRHGLPLCPHVRTERRIVAEAFAAGRSAVEMDPDGKAAAEAWSLWTWLHAELTGAHPRTTPLAGMAQPARAPQLVASAEM